VNEIGRAFEINVGQRRYELVSQEVRTEKILGRNDRTKTVSYSVHCNKQVVEAMADFKNLMIDLGKIEPSLPLTGSC
jgi:hypothetical protein